MYLCNICFNVLNFLSDHLKSIQLGNLESNVVTTNFHILVCLKKIKDTKKNKLTQHSTKTFVLLAQMLEGNLKS